MKNINTISQTKLHPFVYNTTTPAKNVIHFYVKVDTKSACTGEVKVEEQEVTPAYCENCGGLVSPLRKDIYTKYGLHLGYICNNCGCNGSLNY